MNNFLLDIVLAAQKDPESAAFVAYIMIIAIAFALMAVLLIADVRHTKAEDKYGWQRVAMANLKAKPLERHDVKMSLAIIALGLFGSISSCVIGAWLVKITRPEIWSAIWPF